MRITQRLKTVIQPNYGSMTNGPFGNVTVRLATKPAEYATAFRIAYQVYFSLGYTPYSRIGMRMSPYQFRPSTVIFLAYHEGRAVACLSLYEDCKQGLPSDGGWQENLDILRTKRRKIFEIGSLMVLPDCPLRGPGICLAMFRYAWMYARSLRDADTLCAFVQARHALFYKKMLNFNSFAPIQNYQWNQLEIPDVSPIMMNLENAEANYKARFEKYGDGPKNLYRHFVIRGRAKTEQQLRRDFASRKSMDLEALQRRLQACKQSHDNQSSTTNVSVTDSKEKTNATNKLSSFECIECG